MAKVNLTERAKNGRNGQQLCYVVDCIKNSSRAFDEEREFKSDAEALQFFLDCFEKEYNDRYNKRMFPNLSERIGEYLKGLPSCCAIDYWHDKQLMLGYCWGVLETKQGRKAEAFLNNFFTICGLRICQAAQKVGINVYKYCV